jgi:pimeloyl-ACP methyl ester carboxylesterase
MQRRTIRTKDGELSLLEAGSADAPALVLLHGWPQSSAAFEPVLRELERDIHAIAIDLPGVGASRGVLTANDKRTLARCIRGAVEALGLRQVVLAGHDIGGMVAYAYAKEAPASLRGVAILDVVIPGIDPWSEVLRNPHLWHFAFHSVPGLPEKLVAGREAPYFDFFFDALSADPTRIPRRARDAYVAAYARPDALRTAFEWYRAFEQDAKDNIESKEIAVPIPTLCVRGSREPGRLEDYVQGLRDAGFSSARGERIEDCGHFSPDEQPAALAASLRRFTLETSRAG